MAVEDYISAKDRNWILIRNPDYEVIRDLEHLLPECPIKGQTHKTPSTDVEIFKYLLYKYHNKNPSILKNIRIVGKKNIGGTFDDSKLEFTIWYGSEEYYYHLERSNAHYSNPKEIHKAMIEAIKETPESELGIDHKTLLARDVYMENTEFNGWNWTLTGNNGNFMYSYHDLAMKNLLPPYAEKVKEAIEKKINVPDDHFNIHGLMCWYSNTTLKEDERGEEKEKKRKKNTIPVQLELPFMKYSTSYSRPNLN